MNISSIPSSGAAYLAFLFLGVWWCGRTAAIPQRPGPWAGQKAVTGAKEIPTQASPHTHLVGHNWDQLEPLQRPHFSTASDACPGLAGLGGPTPPIFLPVTSLLTIVSATFTRGLSLSLSFSFWAGCENTRTRWSDSCTFSLEREKGRRTHTTVSIWSHLRQLKGFSKDDINHTAPDAAAYNTSFKTTAIPCPRNKGDIQVSKR
ncbi:hypothetical protein QC764_403418 [Podospora pseudoanserina]|uniref:Uncharacterized protein n=1 Tax=Podospora pseudoanserina TaxID=2609844 RepID=A0ABR0I953_9PEZI|nr:hypothetical protein QC764_403418 [Podospora pseudoanserina]